MDLKRKHGWKKDETAMRYINDSKEHPRKMAKMLTGVSSSQPSPQVFSVPQDSPATVNMPSKQVVSPRLMPMPPTDAVKIKLEQGKADKAMPYINLAGASNVTITFN